MNVRAEVIAEMKRQGVTQIELARMTSIPQSRLSEWLTGSLGNRGTSERTINAVLKALGMRVLPKEPPDRSPSSKRKS